MTEQAAESVNAVVAEFGFSSVRTGFAGEDAPQAVIPPVAGVDVTPSFARAASAAAAAVSDDAGASAKYLIGTEAIVQRRDHMELRHFLENGIVTDWDAFEGLLDYSFRHSLRISPEEHAMLFTEPSFNTKAARQHLCELLFEKFHVPAMFVSKDAVLSCFANGRTTGLVVDAGGGTVKTVPVFEGYVISGGVGVSPLAGRRLDSELVRMMRANTGTVIRPRYATQRVPNPDGSMRVKRMNYPDTHPTYAEYSTLEAARDMKESVMRMSESPFDEGTYASIPTIPYELPDGNVVHVGVDRFRVPELLMAPEGVKGVEAQPLPRMVFNSILHCATDLRRDMYSNVVVAGGLSLLPGFSERLSREVAAFAPQAVRVKMVVGGTTERKYSSWLGGSILGSLGSFHEMWMSQSEYSEHGPQLVERKCP